MSSLSCSSTNQLSMGTPLESYRHRRTHSQRKMTEQTLYNSHFMLNYPQERKQNGRLTDIAGPGKTSSPHGGLWTVDAYTN